MDYFMVNTYGYLLVSIVIFLIGLFGVLKRRNLIMLFISTEIMLNAVNLSLVSIARMHNDLNGEVFALFIMAVAAAELTVGLSLTILWYSKTKSIHFDSFGE